MLRNLPQTKRLLAAAIAAVFAAFTCLTPALACQEDAMLVFDTSGSMATAQDGTPKIDIARAAAADVLPELTSRRATGLITYGGLPGAGCAGVALRIPPMIASGDLIIGELASSMPTGSTPLTEAVGLAALTLKSTGKPGTIVLVTDGRENCGYDACAFGLKMPTEYNNIRVHVIGFYLNSSAEASVSCLAKATGGIYTSVDSLDDLKAALKKTLSCPRIS